MILAKTYDNQFEAWKTLTNKFLNGGNDFIYSSDYITFNGVVVSELLHPDIVLPKNPVFSDNYAKQYCEQIVNGNTDTGNSDEEFVYTYHDRLVNHSGCNQIDYIVKELKKNQDSRRAVAVTWKPDVDENCEDVPCMQWVKGLVTDVGDLEQFDMTVLFRSHDMFLGFPMNCCGLTALQRSIAEKLEVLSGTLTVISSSAHIYRKRDIDMMRNLIKNY